MLLGVFMFRTALSKLDLKNLEMTKLLKELTWSPLTVFIRGDVRNIETSNNVLQFNFSC